MVYYNHYSWFVMFQQLSGDVNMALGEVRTLVCLDTDEVLDGIGTSAEVGCDDEGGATPAVAAAAACVAPATCTEAIPTPDAASNLKASHTVSVPAAFDEALYECKDGYGMNSGEKGRGDVDVDDQVRTRAF